MKEPIKVKVVVVAMFERGTPDDGNPGELSYGSRGRNWTKEYHSLKVILTNA